MITLNAARARVSRQKIEQFSGDGYVCPEDIVKKIPYLKSYSDQQYLFGVFSSEETWTVVSVSYLFAAYGGEVVVLQMDEVGDEIYDYFKDNDFSSEAVLTSGEHIWMKTPELSSLILNIILMLSKVPCGTRLE